MEQQHMYTVIDIEFSCGRMLVDTASMDQSFSCRCRAQQVLGRFGFTEVDDGGQRVRSCLSGCLFVGVAFGVVLCFHSWCRVPATLVLGQ